MRETREPPRDEDLPALGRIFDLGLAALVPAMTVDDDPAQARDPDERPHELRLRGHKPGRHATLEVRMPGRHHAVLIRARRPGLEARLYEELAAQGLTGGPGPRVPRLVAWQPESQMLVVEWLDGPALS